MYRCLYSFSPKKILEGETALLANKPRGDFPDFRSILPGFWERWAHSLLLECLPHLLPCLPARACWYHGSMPKAAGIAPAIPVMLPPCRSHIQLDHCSSSLAPFHWTEFGLNSVFSLPHLPQRVVTHLAGWSDGWLICLSPVGTGKRTSDGHPEDLGLWIFPLCCPGTWRQGC